MTEFNVGQKLWWVWSDPRTGDPKSVTIEKVGRKWITLSNGHRIDKESMRADGDGYASPGCCYMSETEYQVAKMRAFLWSDLRRKVEFGAVPNGVTIADIREAARLLRIELTKEPSGG